MLSRGWGEDGSGDKGWHREGGKKSLGSGLYSDQKWPGIAGGLDGVRDMVA